MPDLNFCTDDTRTKRESSWVTWAVDAALPGGKARSPEFAIPGSDEKWCVMDM